MKKRFLSLLCVMALCLGLLPVTALAAAPNGQVIYVGNENVTNGGYWTTDSAGTVTAFTGEGTPADNFIYYDASRNTLTLHNATIRMSVSIDTNTLLAGAAIGVLNQYGDGNAELTITLEGTNTIAEVGKGIFVLANSASTGSSNLTIQGDGSLNASASQTGIWVQSNSKNAALCVENAEVTASSGVAFKNGVLVQAKDGSDVSLTVNGGSLTASVNANIWFQFGSGTSGSGTPTVTVSNNAIVRANGGIANNSSTSIQYGTGSDSTGGIVFDGNTGTVYGKVELQEDLEIGEGETLTIPEGSSLDMGGNEITVASGGKLDGTPTGGTVVYGPTITDQPDNATVTVGQTATFTVAASGSEPLSYKWQESNSSGNWADISGATDATYTTGATTTSMSGYQYRCVVSNSAGSVTSNAATLTVNAATVSVTGVTLTPASLSLFTGDTATLTATVQPSDATNQNVTWSSDKPEVATVENGVVTAKAAGTATITVTTADGNYTATCTVKVNDPVYNMTTNPTTLDFGSVYTGYTQPAAQTVTITNSGNQPLTLTQPAYTSSFVVGPLSTTSLPVNGTATFTVQPKAGLAEGTYSENITVSSSEGATVTIPASFTVEQRDNTPYYGITVNAPANGTVTCYAKSAAKGAEVTLTVKPDVGYALDKLTVTDASGKTVDVTKVDEKTYTFVMPACAVTVEAVFAPITSGLPFTDVSAGDWFYEAVQFVYENGLMDGVGNNLFAPNATLNRAMAVTILYRLEGSPDLDGENLGYPFADVDGDTWYSDAVYWARLNGIVDGVENNHFDPTGSLTREQMATVLYRYAQYKGADVSASGDLSGFADSANVSDWAVDAVKWAVGTGLVNGVEGNALAPQGTSTRAQAAAVLMRLSQAMGG